MFCDEAALSVFAGRGGDGCSSFRREKYVAFGGPNGGDGGKGGNILFVASHSENSLFRIRRRRILRAGSGQPGSSNNKSGAGGEDVILIVPLGTQVRDAKHGNLMADLASDQDRVVVASGGRGGRGNARFARATRQAPEYAELGKDGESRELLLELKLVADVGLVGLPNAGKSTLLSRVTSARPRVADYPFTTLNPSLGIWETQDVQRPTLVLADIPGLIEGAHEGKGLGHQFLRHVERTRVLLHMVDCSAGAEDPRTSWETIRKEIEAFSSELGTRPWILVGSKVEDAEAEERAQDLFQAAGVVGLAISSVTGQGLPALLHRLLRDVSG